MDASKLIANFNRNAKLNQVGKSELCGCYYCLDIFSFYQIVDWADREKDTAICPGCGIDSVIGSASGYPITREFLNRMKVMWFSDH
ncbi:MAG: cytoplasmic protein [Cyanobacteria bacterium TGS_CYA1]|nr:cytoplasmic protein [Cyanobacteria bacterium TGS_CYA1]